jgi:hypothetical protein
MERASMMKRMLTFKRIVVLAMVIAVGWLVIPSVGGAGPEKSRGLAGLLLNKLDEIISLQKDILKGQIVIRGDLAQCAPPDLVPIPLSGNPGPSGMCRLNDSQELIVRVLNQGGSAAGASTLRVTFDNGTVVDTPTPGLSFGASIDILVGPFPAGCSISDCGFQISVDDTNAVIESNELNNNAAGLCIG